MKTKEEIEYLAEEYAYIGREANLSKREFTLEKMGFINGYNQCLEDNKDKKYTEDDIKEAAYFFVGYKTAKNQDIFDKDIYAFIESLNKQD